MFTKLIVAFIITLRTISVSTGEHQQIETNYIQDFAHHRPQYIYKYGVEDPHTGDIKSHEEHREGDLVKGEYSFVQPDGKTRIVTYASDKHGGFHAYVTYFGGDDIKTLIL